MLLEPLLIPVITHPLGAYWEQPNLEDILLDETHALIDMKAFRLLATYSDSNPSGVYPGKVWKASSRGVWYLRWYGYSELADHCSNNQLELLILTDWN